MLMTEAAGHTSHIVIAGDFLPAKTYFAVKSSSFAFGVSDVFLSMSGWCHDAAPFAAPSRIQIVQEGGHKPKVHRRTKAPKALDGLRRLETSSTGCRRAGGATSGAAEQQQQSQCSGS